MPNPPTFRETNPSDAPIMILSMQSDQAPITEVDDYAENLVRSSLAASGRGAGAGGGQQTPAIRVQVDPAKLASMGMTLEDVRTVLTNVTVDNPKGSIDGPQQSFTIYANDQLTDGGTIQQRHHRLSQRRADPHRRYRPRGRRPAEPRVGGVDRTASPRSCCWCSSRPTPTSSPPPTA